MKVKILYIVALFFLFSCANDDTLNIEKIKEKQIKVENKQDFTIPLEEAIQNLNNTLDIIEQHEQQSNTNGLQRISRKSREIENVEVVYSTPKNTANNGMMKAPSNIGDKLLYIVQFKDNQGGAILSADKRIDGEVLAITDYGNILEKQEPRDYDQLFKAYPDFKFYNEELDDYYVGNMPEGLENIGLDMCKKYALTKAKSDIELGFDPSSNGTKYYRISTPWKVLEKRKPMLTTAWHQGKPFNNTTPLRRWFFWQEWTRSPAGCVPVALAQIMAYHEYPPLYRFTTEAKWKDVKEVASIYNRWYDGNKTTQEATASLLSSIGVHCSTIYTPSFSFTFPTLAKFAMTSFGYRGVYMERRYNTDKIIRMLNKNNPVFVAGISGWKDGHAWVVDGYITRFRKIEIRKNSDDGEIDSSWSENETLVHCNFGWRGFCNGYYLTKLFDLENSPREREEYEKNFGKGNDLNFSWFFHTIFYNNPNK